MIVHIIMLPIFFGHTTSHNSKNKQLIKEPIREKIARLMKNFGHI